MSKNVQAAAKHDWLACGVIVLITVAVVVAEIFSQKETGLTLFCVAGVGLLLADEKSRRQLTVGYGAVLLLLLAPITTDTTDAAAGLRMFLILSIAIVVPVGIDRLFNTNVIRFRNKQLSHAYILRATIAVSLLATAVFTLLPDYLQSTGSYRNWLVEDNFGSYLYLFIGAFFVGVWDELFFVNCILPSFAKKLPFLLANAFSSAIFVSFLWSIGFRSWGPLVLYPFAYIQGYVYHKTGSLKLIITTHLILDIILILALINSHFPDRVPIFVF